MLHQTISFFRWFPKTFRLHGIHSPFIFDFQRKCLLGSTPTEIRSQIKRFRESVIIDHSTITVNDHGAGSRVFKSDQRVISKLAKTAGSTVNNCELIYRICDYLGIGKVLELGTCLGMATHAISLAAEIVNTVEGSSDVAARADMGLSDYGVRNTSIYSMTFDDYFEQLSLDSVYDLIYIDGHHEGEATLRYFRKALKHAHKKTVLIFDDIYWSPDMTEAWKIICASPEVTACVDIYDWGIVFLRPELHKQVYRVRV